MSVVKISVSVEKISKSVGKFLCPFTSVDKISNSVVNFSRPLNNCYDCNCQFGSFVLVDSNFLLSVGKISLKSRRKIGT